MYASRYTGRGAITFRYENGTAVEPELKSAINQQMHATFESMEPSECEQLLSLTRKYVQILKKNTKQYILEEKEF